MQGKSPTQYLGVLSRNPPNLTIAEISPSSTNTAFPKGELWLNDVSETVFMNNGGGVWIALGSGVSGDLVTLTGGSGGAISPSGGNITLAGTANQITTTGSGSTITWTLPSAITTPGSLTTTTSLVSGTTIASGTTITAGTSLTATSGNITATNGNIVKGTAGNKDVYTSVGSSATAGANSAGLVTLVSGSITVATTAITTNSLVRLTRYSVGATGSSALGMITLGTIVNGVSFAINAWQYQAASNIQPSDVSVIFWEIVN